jgi:salicylate hydroxylase
MQRDRSLEAVFNAYETHRRARVEEAYKDADWRWSTIREPSYVRYKMMEWVTPWFLWFTVGKRRKTFEEDLTITALDF